MAMTEQEKIATIRSLEVEGLPLMDFPLSMDEVVALYKTINTIDFEYFDGLQSNQIKPEDIDKIAIIYRIIEALEDVPKSRIEYLVKYFDLQFPDFDTLCVKYDI